MQTSDTTKRPRGRPPLALLPPDNPIQKERERQYRYRDTRKRWKRANRDKVLANNRKYLYGLTEQEYQALHVAQAGKCAICGVPESELKRGLHVDHCHTTGRVRGLLCDRCNVALGMFGDDAARMQRAALYLTAD